MGDLELVLVGGCCYDNVKCRSKSVDFDISRAASVRKVVSRTDTAKRAEVALLSRRCGCGWNLRGRTCCKLFTHHVCEAIAERLQALYALLIYCWDGLFHSVPGLRKIDVTRQCLPIRRDRSGRVSLLGRSNGRARTT